MPRPAEFEADAALEAATDLFRRRGYEGTSMADLVEHLGVARAGIYREFGSKHGLYVQALARYRAEHDPAAVARLRADAPAATNLRSLLEDYAGQAVEDDRGCLVVNSATELGTSDGEVAGQVAQSWRTLHDALTAALRAGQPSGDLPVAGDPEALAALVLATLQGIRVLGRGGADPALVRLAAGQLAAMVSGDEATR